MMMMAIEYLSGQRIPTSDGQTGEELSRAKKKKKKSEEEYN
jgi:hypothetical protein